MLLDKILNLPNHQKILLIGLGKEMQQFLEWLLKVVKIQPEAIILADQNPDFYIPLLDGKTFAATFFGENYLQSLTSENLEYVFKAPGIWSLKPEFEAFRQKNGQDKILSSLVFFMEKYRDQIIGITGTKGKTTTASLIAHLLNQIGYGGIYCGNTTGVSPYKFWQNLEEKSNPNQYFVIELSSFQLEDLGYSKISPKFGLVTNYFVDHLDQHSTKKEYWGSKDNLLKNLQKGDFRVVSDQILGKTAVDLDSENFRQVTSQDSQDLQELFGPNLLGKHNWENATRALVLLENLSGNLGSTSQIISDLKGKKTFYSDLLASYKRLPHRLDLVRTLDLKELTINFYDDGVATEPDAVAAAIEALSEKENEFLWLQLAGKDKGVELFNLLEIITKKQKQFFRIDFCGAVGQRIYKELYQHDLNLIFLKNVLSEMSLNFKVEIEKFLAFISASRGEFDSGSKPILNILFSPCGSSFDEFDKADQRADFWIQTVKEIEFSLE